MTKVMSTRSKFVRTIRNTLIQAVSRLAPFQRAFVRRLSQLSIAYRGRSIAIGTGERYFDDSMRGGGGAGRHLVLTGNNSDPSAMEAAMRETGKGRHASPGIVPG